ncbi:23S rRNA (uracil(1939)-C(5))-methyltransferase, partial [Francisella tularensis subsp. holarctica]|nr:23S rRNA (uracil(1939)-C(5))-methyltransferase [Francisella tularensis subsp. holarctica]
VEPENILPPLRTSNTAGYRNKARLGVRYVSKKGKILVGLRERNGRFLADIDKCIVLNPLVCDKITEISSFIETLSIYQH